MYMAIQHTHRSEALQVSKCLRAVVSAPAPFRVNGPQRNMREDNHRRAAGKALDVFLQPCQLFLAQLSKPAAAEPGPASLLQIQDIDQADEQFSLLDDDLSRHLRM